MTGEQNSVSSFLMTLFKSLKKNARLTSSANKGGKSDYLVIDGQQRITTISILFTAMVNLMKSGIVVAKDNRLAEKIEKKFLVDEYQTEERKLRLKPM